MASRGTMRENTCNAILTEELNKRGIPANFERHFATLEGTKKPDIFVVKDGYYFIEGKQRPAQLIHAVSKAHVYRETTKATVAPKAVFGVLYPEGCVGPCEAAILLDTAPYYIEHRAKSLSELADWIKEFIERPATPSEINTAHAIRLLNQAVDSLSIAFTKLDFREIEEIFGGKMFFETVLGYEEEEKVPKQHLRIAAAYLLVNQILFYQVLARETKDFEILNAEKLAAPSELQKIYFAKVLLRDYKPIFDFDVSSRLRGQEALEAVRITINTINALTPEKHGHDILGKIFHNLIPFEIRKSVAAFFTNSEAAEMLASLAIEQFDAKVIDPASGSGTLLVAAYRRKKELLEKEEKKQFSLSGHKRFLEKEITGIDIMPFSAHLAAVHLALQAPLYLTDKVRIAIHDSTTLEPGKTVEAAQETLKEAYKTTRISDYFGEAKDDIRRKVLKGTVTLSDKSNKPLVLDKVDVAIMNPPFTRSERLPDEYKKLLMERFRDYQKLVFGKVGLHLFFIFLADKFLKKGGKVALVLPATVLRLQSMKGARELLLEKYHIEYIIASFQRSAFSEAARFREVLIVATKIKEIKDNTPIEGDLVSHIIILKKLPRNLSESREFASKIKQLSAVLSADEEHDDDYLNINAINQNRLKEIIDNIFSLISISDPLLLSLWNKLVKKSGEKLVSCDKYFHQNNISASIAPFDSEFNFETTFRFITQPSRALKNKDIWVIHETKQHNVVANNRFTGRKINIPINCLVPGLRRPSGTSRINITNELDYLIINRFNGIEEVISEKGKIERVLKNASNWYRSVKTAHVILSRKFNISAPGTRIVGFYSGTKVFGIDVWNVTGLNEDDAKIFSIWFNSTPSIFQLIMNRTETEGPWMKLNQSEILNSLILNIQQLSSEDKKVLLNLFNKVSLEEMPSISDQLRTRNPIRVSIDRAILKILGFSASEIETILDKLYPSLYEEIQKLKSMVIRENLKNEY